MRATTQQPAHSTERIDDALLESMLFSVATYGTRDEWRGALLKHRAVAPESELPWVNRALAWTASATRDLAWREALEIAHGFQAIYWDDHCITAIVGVELSATPDPSLVDTFAACFPMLSRAYQHLGARCERAPEKPELREPQLRKCVASFTRCLALDPRNGACVIGRDRARDEYLAPFCTTGGMIPALRAVYVAPSGRMTLDLADFAYAVRVESATILILSARGRDRVASWSSTTASGHLRFGPVRLSVRSGEVLASAAPDRFFTTSPLPDVCDAVQQRDAQSLE